MENPKNIELNELKNIELEDVAFEFTNVFDKESDEERKKLVEMYGEKFFIKNDYERRTKNEIRTALRIIKYNLKIDLEEIKIINLPFTIIKSGRQAQTAFTDRHCECKKIYLVPDDTALKVKRDKKYHLTGILNLYINEQIDELVYAKWYKEIEKLNIGERVTASILHEYGHILTYNKLDICKIYKPLELYNLLDETNYLDNCSLRICNFGDISVITKLNTCLEMLAEDYRVSNYIKKADDVCMLPHSISYLQDIINPIEFLKGVDIMGKLLDLNVKERKGVVKPLNSLLDKILPFGEGSRTIGNMQRFTTGQIVQLTEMDKIKDREALKALL
ncbi:hypothetical protein [Clostridium sp.]|uniref:hypothetical protein n=1 Tax=Clostridium sp. TaxID=1506 RepID=UPI001A434172|nr:hypothetical protein [Clostridium sp.]MBK5234896.1 hypothetical protein [Clostridium sp.]